MTDKPRFQFDDEKILELGEEFDLTEDELNKLFNQLENNINEALKYGRLKSITEEEGVRILRKTFSQFSLLPLEARLDFVTSSTFLWYDFELDKPRYMKPVKDIPKDA